jgi:hypothetical protein
MDRPQPNPSATRSVADLVDVADLRSVISAALTTSPVNEEMLRRGIWTLVGVERDAGASAGDVVTELTNLLNAARIRPLALRQRRLHQVILWCVEAYFGHLGGDVTGRELIDSEADSAGDPSLEPRVASNR